MILNLKSLGDPAERAGAGGPGDSMKDRVEHGAESGERGRKLMRKNVFGLTLCAMLFALCSLVEAQQPKKTPRVGFLTAGSASSESASVEAFRNGLGALGYVEGEDVVVEYRHAEFKYDQLPALATELLQLKVDIILATSTLAARPAKAATKKTPSVVLSGDLVATGLVASLARPGGNVTGLSNLSPDLSGKRLELLKETVPGIVRIGVLWDTEGPGPRLVFKETQNAAEVLKLQLQSLEIRGPKPDLDAAFKAAITSRARALLTIGNPLMTRHRGAIVDRAGKNRLPAMYPDRRFMDAGGLMSYGVDQNALYSRLSYYVDKILKGAKPADLPVEQPTKFEFVINLKTAKQIGLIIPPNILARADRVIR
jgi:putative ABC transport system substrate-binding protein